MDRVEATYLLNNLRAFGKDDSDDEAIDLAIEALVLQDKYVKALERMIEGAKEINKFLEEAVKKTDEKHQLSAETSTISAETSTISAETSTISENESHEDGLFNKSFWRMGMHDTNVRPPVKHWCQYKQRPCEYANSWGKCLMTACVRHGDERLIYTTTCNQTCNQTCNKKQVTSKLKNPDDSLLTADSDECKEQKSKLEPAEIATSEGEESTMGQPTERTGEWLEVDSWNSERHAVTDMKCSECHKYASYVLPLNTTCTYPYCPNCGAKMKGGTENE